MASQTTSAKWARWQWSKGTGRAHRLFHDGDLTKTACQTPRKTADHTAVQTFAAKPGSGPICSRCDLFDQLHQKFVATTDVVAPMTIAPASEPLPEPALPATVACACGCDRSEDFVAWKHLHDAWIVAETARKSAEFEALVASGAFAKGTVAA